MAKRIGELLVEAAVLSQSQLEQALFAQRKDGRKLGQLLIELGLVSEVALTQTLSRQLSVAWVSLYHVDFSRSLLNLVTKEIAEQYCLVPVFVKHVRHEGNTLYVAMDDPTNESALEEVARAASLPVKSMIACGSDIRAAIRVYYLGGSPSSAPPAKALPPQTQGEPSVRSASASPSDTSSAAAPGAPNPAPAVGPPGTFVLAAAPSAAPQSIPLGTNVGKPRQLATVPEPSDTGTSSNAREDSQQQQPGNDIQREIPATTSANHEPAGINRPRMVSLTLLDGTTVALPAPLRKATAARADTAELSDQLTGRDLVSALRAVAHGADASEILGQEPRWEAMFSALLSVLLRKGLIADWEFIEEFRKI